MEDTIHTVLVDALVTCRTVGCPENGNSIAVKMVEATGIAACGTCEQIISDVVLT